MLIWRNSSSVLEALKPGTRVKLYLCTGLAGGYTAVVMKMENEKGESIAKMEHDRRQGAGQGHRNPANPLHRLSRRQKFSAPIEGVSLPSPPLLRGGAFVFGVFG